MISGKLIDKIKNPISSTSMQEFGVSFIDALPKHIESLRISARKKSEKILLPSEMVQIGDVAEIQNAMREVLFHPTTRQAQLYTESTFKAFLDKDVVDAGLLQFLNGWNDTHKTTSLVSAKIIMRLSADAVFVPIVQHAGYHKTMAHMHEVAKDDFGLGHPRHDGMYTIMTSALMASDWMSPSYEVPECKEFAGFLYEAGVAQHKSPLDSSLHNESILNAMMISIASETWNGREFNYIAQHIEQKLLSANPILLEDAARLRNAKGYVMGHAGQVENKHGLHALAAAQVFSRTRGLPFDTKHLQEVMLDYNARVGRAFNALHRALTPSV